MDMFNNYVVSLKNGTPHRSLFVTGNSTLRDKLAGLYYKLRYNRYGKPPPFGPRHLDLNNSKENPLFVTGAEIIVALDKTLLASGRSFLKQEQYNAGQTVIGLAYESGTTSILQKINEIGMEDAGSTPTLIDNSHTTTAAVKRRRSDKVQLRREMNYSRFLDKLKKEGIPQPMIATTYK
jgi:hypothetical protein